jgi:hypothetical protein
MCNRNLDWPQYAANENDPILLGAPVPSHCCMREIGKRHRLAVAEDYSARGKQRLDGRKLMLPPSRRV